MKKWFRRTLRRYGIELPFTQVVCPERVRRIEVDAKWRVKVTVNSTLVFLSVPEEGDLWDVIPVDTVTDLDSAIYASPDANELGRRRKGPTTLVYWEPREKLTPYALYGHQHGWSSAGWEGRSSLYTEFRCDVRTGILALEVIAPVAFETAVVFKRPRWRSLKTERSLVKYGLAQLEAGTDRRPVIRDNGQRVEWRVVGPNVGDRFICIVFTAEGIAQWRQQLKETSIAGRVRGAIRSVVPT